MPTIEANPPLTTTTAHCPLCDAPLDPHHPDACTKCDWVAPGHAEHHAGGSLRDKIAVCLSVVPGLGHIYKGHKLTGALYMLGAALRFSPLASPAPSPPASASSCCRSTGSVSCCRSTGWKTATSRPSRRAKAGIDRGRDCPAAPSSARGRHEKERS